MGGRGKPGPRGLRLGGREGSVAKARRHPFVLEIAGPVTLDTRPASHSADHAPPSGGKREVRASVESTLSLWPAPAARSNGWMEVQCAMRMPAARVRRAANSRSRGDAWRGSL